MKALALFLLAILGAAAVLVPHPEPHRSAPRVHAETAHECAGPSPPGADCRTLSARYPKRTPHQSR